MKWPLLPLAWRISTPRARNMALASVVSLVAAIILLVVEGIKATRFDYLVIAGVLVLLLGTAWLDAHWQTEAKS